jgi:hypothetical protein
LFEAAEAPDIADTIEKAFQQEHPIPSEYERSL